jgi:general secretion pathway protein G
VKNSIRKSITLPSSAKGMTLLELVVVIVLIGGLLAVLSNRLIGSKSRAEYKLAQTQISGLSQKIEQYQVDLGDYPKTLDALVSAPETADNWLGPYAKPVEFKDPWGTNISYKPDDESGTYVLISLGADRKPGGEGVDKDIRVSP